MSKGKVTSKQVATKASALMQSKTASKTAKSVAASALAQAKPKKK